MFGLGKLCVEFADHGFGGITFFDEYFGGNSCDVEIQLGLYSCCPIDSDGMFGSFTTGVIVEGDTPNRIGNVVLSATGKHPGEHGALAKFFVGLYGVSDQ